MIGSLAKNAVKARLKWLKRALPHQLPPSEADSWSTWWLNAGRGAGKTRCAAEWVWWQAWRRPKTRGLVLAPTANDLRFTCFEGESGLLNVIPQELIANYNKSTHELLFKNGSHIRGISGDSYERLRGPQFAFAWVDEIGAFEYSQQAWSMMQFGLRLGNHPRVICTSTPKPIPLLFSLKKDMELKKGNVIITNASTYANIKNLSPTFQNQLLAFEGTELGRQEIHAELLESVNSIFPFESFKQYENGNGYPKSTYIINCVDTATSDKDYNDYSAGCTLICFESGGRVCVLVAKIWRGHYQYPELKDKIIEESERKFSWVAGGNEFAMGVHLTIVENASSGISIAQDIARLGINIRGRKTTALNKIERAMLASDVVSKGFVYLLQSNELDDEGEYKDAFHQRYYDDGWIDEITLFPNQPLEMGLTGEAAKRKEGFDDQVDAFVMGLSHLKKIGLIGAYQLPEVVRYADDDLLVNPYAQ